MQQRDVHVPTRRHQYQVIWPALHGYTIWPALHGYTISPRDQTLVDSCDGLGARGEGVDGVHDATKAVLEEEDLGSPGVDLGEGREGEGFGEAGGVYGCFALPDCGGCAGGSALGKGEATIRAGMSARWGTR